MEIAMGHVMSLKKLRRDRGWSLEQLAAISGVSARTIQRIEKGGAAGMETLKALAAGFEMSVAEVQKYIPGNQEEETMLEADAGMIPKKWKGFLLHVIAYMVLMTWLFFIGQYFELEMKYIVLVMFVWGMYLAVHLMGMFGEEKK